MNKYLIILLLMFAFGCKMNNPKNIESVADTPTFGSVNKEFKNFNEYLDAITEIDLPFEYTCNEDIKKVIDIKSKYRPEGSSIIGRLKSINDKHYIIYAYASDILLPILEIYNNEGFKIKQIELLDMRYCSFEFENQYSKFIIQNDTIFMLKNFKIENSDTIIEKSETINLNKLY